MIPSLGETALLLVNPASGRGRALKHWKATAAALRAAGFTTTVQLTENLHQGTELAANAAPGSLLAVLGGDGFLGAAAAGAKDSGAVLLPLAGGSGNDTTRRLGLALDPVKAVASVPGLVIRDIDLGLVNGRPFLGVAHVGFDALANELGNAARLNLGPLMYLYGGIKAFRQWRRVSFTVEVDGATRSFGGWLVAVGNAGQYGGGLRIAPHARLDDGLLDVVSLGAASSPGVVAMFLRSYRGKHLVQRQVAFVRGSAVRIGASKPLNIYADGELVGALPAEIRMLPAALKVLVPADSPAFGRAC